MGRHLWAFDVDGTLLRSDGTMSRAVREALRSLAEAGDVVALATGRSIAATREVLELLPWVEWAVCANGAATLHRGGPRARPHALVHHHDLPAAPLVRHVLTTDTAARVAVEDASGTCAVNEHFEPGELMGVSERREVGLLGAHGAFRVTVRPSRPGTTFGFEHDVSVLARPDIGRRTWFDLVAPGVDKATALERVRVRLGIEPGRTHAAGDESNDVGMVRWAAHGAALGDRCTELAAVADRVLPDADADGVLDFLAGAATTRPVAG